MNTLNGFLGVEFSSSLEITKEKLNERFGLNLSDSNNDPNYLIYNSVTFGGRTTEYMILTFFEDKFSNASVYIKPNLESKVVETYKIIKEEINEKYFVSIDDYEFYEKPYEKDDGYTESAISLGKATFSSYWNFANSGYGMNCICVEINENLEIIITYQNSNLMEQIVNRNKRNNSLDY